MSVVLHLLLTGLLPLFTPHPVVTLFTSPRLRNPLPTRAYCNNPSCSCHYISQSDLEEENAFVVSHGLCTDDVLYKKVLVFSGRIFLFSLFFIFLCISASCLAEWEC